MRQISHHQELYLTEPEQSAAARKVSAIAALLAGKNHPLASTAARQRTIFTRFVDHVLLLTRTHLPPLHWAGAAISAAILFVYAWILALTVRLVRSGDFTWPDLPRGSVLAVWHGSAPSLLVALLARMPADPIAIMVASDPRGDCLAWLCRLVGLQVVRGDSDHGGWEALTVLARRLERGACALITADGGGPAREAKAGAVALASATGRPLVALGAACRPAIFERHKWDAARTPLPFARVGIVVGESRTIQLFTDAGEVETARLWLQSALDAAEDNCRRALGLSSLESA